MELILVHVNDFGTGRYHIGLAEDKFEAQKLAIKMLLKVSNRGDYFNKAVREKVKNGKFKDVVEYAQSEEFGIDFKRVKTINKAVIEWE